MRHLVREVSGDKLYLAVYAAMGETEATKEEARQLLDALRDEQQSNGFWPKGFMPEVPEDR